MFGPFEEEQNVQVSSLQRKGIAANLHRQGKGIVANLHRPFYQLNLTVLKAVVDR